MNIKVGSKYKMYAQQLAFNLRVGYADSHQREDLKALCYFCRSGIEGRGFLLSDSYSSSNEILMVAVHCRCRDSAIRGEFDTSS